MSKQQEISCANCGEKIDYPSEEEGKVIECPSCKDPVWLSHLSDVDQPWAGSRHDQVHAESPDRQTFWNVALGIAILLFLLLGTEIYRLKKQVASMQDSIRTITVVSAPAPATQAPAIPSNDSANRELRLALNNAALNQADIDQIIAALAVIDADLESRLAALRKQSSEDRTRIDALATSVDGLRRRISDLQYGNAEAFAEISEAMENMMLEYTQLEQQLPDSATQPNGRE